MFLDKCFQEGMIFEKWLDYWAKRWLKKNKPEILLEISGMEDEQMELQSGGKFETVRDYAFSKVKWFWFKPFGYCVVCMNVWISFMCLPLAGLGLLTGLFFILLSSLIVRICLVVLR